MSADASFETWALVEILGHQRAAGRVTEAIIAGSPMVRIEIPKGPDSSEYLTQYINTTSIFRMTPVDEATVRTALKSWEWKAHPLLPAPARDYDEIEQGDDADPTEEFS